MFGKGIDTACSVKQLNWIDENNNEQALCCFYESGDDENLKDY